MPRIAGIESITNHAKIHGVDYGQVILPFTVLRRLDTVDCYLTVYTIPTKTAPS